MLRDITTYIDLCCDDLDLRRAMMSDSCPCTVNDFVVRGNAYRVCQNDLNVDGILDLLRVSDSGEIDVTPT